MRTERRGEGCDGGGGEEVGLSLVLVVVGVVLPLVFGFTPAQSVPARHAAAAVPSCGPTPSHTEPHRAPPSHQSPLAGRQAT